MMFCRLGNGSNLNQTVINMENFNARASNLYSESNQVYLEVHKEVFEFSSNEWAGFQQWKSVGRKVMKGAKGCKILMVCEKKKRQS